MPAPEGYELLPKGVRCRCLYAWQDADGSHWCGRGSKCTDEAVRGRLYDGAVVNEEGDLVIPRQKPFVEPWE